jgi:hypothetical protein
MNIKVKKVITLSDEDVKDIIIEGLKAVRIIECEDSYTIEAKGFKIEK